MDKQYLTPAEAGKQLNVTDAAVRYWIRDGKITYTKVGGRYRIKQSDLDTMVTQQNKLQR